MLAVERRFPAALVFLASVAYLWFLRAHYLVLNTDEGIYYDGALRILAGETPYRDFFTLTGPGSFWLHALAFRVFGISLAVARLPVILDVSILATCMYLVTARLARPAVAILPPLIFVVLTASNPVLITGCHRWDSSAFATLAVTLSYLSRKRSALLLSGALAAGAAWITPTVGLIALPLIGWNIYRKQARPFLVGFCAASAIAVGVLAYQGGLIPMCQSMLWARNNYGGANRVPYGAPFGILGQTFKNVTGSEWIIGAVMFACLAFPALVPVVATGGWLLRIRLEGWPEIAFLLGSSAALFLSTLPRWDMAHLQFISPIYLALTAALFYRWLRSRWQIYIAVVTTGTMLAVFLACSLADRSGQITLQTPVGRVRGRPRDVGLLAGVLEKVKPGERVFAYPYIPTLYFLTGTKGATRYSWIYPGFATKEDESAMLADLQANPPHRILYSDVPPAVYLQAFPSTDPSRMRLPRMDKYLNSEYSVIQKTDDPTLPMAVLEYRHHGG